MSDDKTSWNIELDEQLLQDLYAWIDQVPLSRSKRRIERDFSDGGFHFHKQTLQNCCLIIYLYSKSWLLS